MQMDNNMAAIALLGSLSPSQNSNLSAMTKFLQIHELCPEEETHDGSARSRTKTPR